MSSSASYFPQEWQFFWYLWHDRSWMIRRVDKTTIIDRDRMQLDMTFTIDNRRIRYYLRRFGFTYEKLQQIPLPLFLWKRKPILDVDMKDDKGNRLAVATGNANTRLAECILLGDFNRNGYFGQDSSEFTRFSTDLYHTLRTGSFQKYDEATAEAESSLAAPEVDTLQSMSRSQKENILHYLCWRDFLNSVDTDTLLQFVQSYIFVAYVNVDPDIDMHVISCRLAYHSKFRLGRPRFGRSTYDHDIKATVFDGADKRIHMRLVAPEGMRISHLEFLDADTNNRISSENLLFELTPELIEITKSKDSNIQSAAIKMQVCYMPKRSTFVVPSTFLSAICSLVMIGVLVSIFCVHTKPGGSLAAITALMAVAAAVVSKDINHDVASHVCERSRWCFAYIFASVFLGTSLFVLFGNKLNFASGIFLLTAISSALFTLSNITSIVRMRKLTKRGCIIK